MKRFLLFFAMLAMGLSVYAQSIAGSWEGNLEVSPFYSLKIVLNINEIDGALSATMDSPDQGAKGIPVDEVTFEDSSLTFTLAKLGVKYEGKMEDEAINGTFTQQGHSFPLILKRAKEVVKVELSYHSEDLHFRNPESGLKVAGTITRPFKEGKYPAVVLIAGSGPMNRDSKVMKHKPLADIADYLTRQGIVVLRYDKRGVGESESEFGGATFNEFASDARAMISCLSSKPYVDTNALGVIGHSEGGIISQIIGANHPQLIDFMVLLASPATSTIDILAHQNMITLQDYLIENKSEEMYKNCRNFFKSIIAHDATRESDSINLMAFNEKVLTMVKPEHKELITNQIFQPEAIQMNLNIYRTPYFQKFLKYNPVDNLKKISCPVLAIIGEKDTQVPAKENLKVTKKALGNRVLAKEYPLLNHLFLTCETGSFMEYPYLEGSFSEDVLKDITTWIKDGYSL